MAIFVSFHSIRYRLILRGFNSALSPFLAQKCTICLGIESELSDICQVNITESALDESIVLFLARA